MAENFDLPVWHRSFRVLTNLIRSSVINHFDFEIPVRDTLSRYRWRIKDTSLTFRVTRRHWSRDRLILQRPFPVDQGDREFEFWNWKIPPPTKKFPKIAINHDSDSDLSRFK